MREHALMLAAFIVAALAISSVASASVISIPLNTYYDLDTGNSGTNNASMDIYCSRVQQPSNAQVTPVNGAVGAIVASANYTNVVGLRWDTTARNLFVGAPGTYSYWKTNKGNYVRVFSWSATNGFCEFESIGSRDSALSVTPLFNGSYGGTLTFTFQHNDSLSYMLDMKSLGWYVDNASTYATFNQANYPVFDVYFDSWANRFIPVRAGWQYIGRCPTPGDGTYILACSSRYAASNQFAVMPIFTTGTYLSSQITDSQANGVYDYFQWNTTVPNIYAVSELVESRTDLGDPGNVRRDIRISLAYYNASAFDVITGVSHSPVVPTAGRNVTITFHTTQPKDGAVFWRYRNLTLPDLPASYSMWFSNTQVNASTFGIIINGPSFIFDKKYYQFYVTAGTITDNNTDAFYNFTVGAYGNFGNQTGMFPQAASSLENTGFCTGSSCVWIIGVILAVLISGAAVYVGGITLGAVVGGGAITVFSVVGLLPNILLLPIVVLILIWVAKKANILGGGE